MPPDRHPATLDHPRSTGAGAFALIALAALLAGCQSTPDMPKAPEMPSVPALVEVDAVTEDSEVTERVGKAAITPLSDINVVQQKIPEALRHAQKVGPYALPEKPDCPTVQDEINRLTDALGPDLDDPNLKGKPSLLERGSDAAENYGVGFVRRTVEGLVPFRSWVRKLSGAEKHSKEVASAILAGGVRRAYLKGMRQGMGCPIPATKKAAELPAQPAPTTSAAMAASPASAASAPNPSTPASPATEP